MHACTERHIYIDTYIYIYMCVCVCVSKYAYESDYMNKSEKQKNPN